MTAVAKTAVTLAEIRALIAELPRLDPVVVPEAASYGRAGEWLMWLARAQGHRPDVQRTRLAVFAGAHGCMNDSAAQTRATLAPLTDSTAPTVKVLQGLDADLRVYELDLETPTADFREGPALDEGAAAHAMTYGMMAVEVGVQLIALAGVGAGGEAAHRELLARLPKSDDALATLVQTGGLEICAMIGAILAARLAKVPVLLDGVAAETAAAVLARISPEATLHCASVQALEPDLTDKAGLAGALALGRIKALACLG